MRIFVTRHGQPGAATYINNDNRFPMNDIALTEIGRQQATLLGKHLKELDFHGIIYSSPYRRTMQTATLIAEQLDLPITVLGGIREILFHSASERPYKFLSPQELEAEFPRCTAKGLDYPWWSDHAEESEEVHARVQATLDEVLGDRTGPDVLFVGHGASTYACRRYLGINNRCDPKGPWNCGLSMLDTDTGENYSFDVSFLPEELITDNKKTLEEQNAENK